MPRKREKEPKGRRLPQTKLEKRDIDGIFYLYFQEGVSQSEIARLYRVHRSTVSLIVRNLRRQGTR